MLGKVLSLTALATLCSPYFISGAIYPFVIFRNYGYRIVENQSIPFLQHLSLNEPQFLWYWITLILVVLSSAFVLWRFLKTSKENRSLQNEKLLLAPTALALTFAVLGFIHIRFIATFALLSLPVLACNFSTLKNWLMEKWKNVDKKIDDDLKIILVGLFVGILFVLVVASE